MRSPSRDRICRRCATDLRHDREDDRRCRMPIWSLTSGSSWLICLPTATRLCGSDRCDGGSRTDRLQSRRWFRFCRCEKGDLVAAIAKLPHQQMGVHFQATSERFCDRVFQMCDDADAQESSFRTGSMTCETMNADSQQVVQNPGADEWQFQSISR